MGFIILHLFITIGEYIAYFLLKWKLHCMLNILSSLDLDFILKNYV